MRSVTLLVLAACLGGCEPPGACQSDEECDAGEVCVGEDEGGSHLRFTEPDPGQCQARPEPVRAPEGCDPACAAGSFCDLVLRRCEPLGRLGEPCQQDSTCAPALACGQRDDERVCVHAGSLLPGAWCGGERGCGDGLPCLGPPSESRHLEHLGTRCGGVDALADCRRFWRDGGMVAECDPGYACDTSSWLCLPVP